MTMGYKYTKFNLPIIIPSLISEFQVYASQPKVRDIVTF